MRDKRVSWDEFFIGHALWNSVRSPCLRRRVGAVVVKDNRIIGGGYNGPPSDAPHCETCIKDEQNIPHGEGDELCPNNYNKTKNLALLSPLYNIVEKVNKFT